MNSMIEASNPTIIDKENWFPYLKEVSNDLKDEFVLRNIIDQPTIDQLLKLSDIALMELCRQKSFEYGFRLWHQDDQKNVHFVNTHVFNNAIKNNENIETWMKRAFPEKEICIIMNNVEHFADEIAVVLSNFFKSVYENLGIPMNGLHSTSIFGNYGFTPLGIHHDTRGSFVMNIHLGPSIKKMYIWEWDKFEALGGKTNEKNIEKYLPYAKVYIINPGDMFFMPWNKYHIGYTDGFSLSMTNWFDFHTALRLLSDLTAFMSSQFLKLKEDFISKSVTEFTYQKHFEDLLGKFLFEGGREHVSLKENLLDAHDFKMLKLFSNCGWKGIPLTRQYESGLSLSNFDMLKDRAVKVTNPFKIYTKIQKGNLYVISRGHISQYPYSKKLELIIEKLNTHEAFNTNDLVIDKPDNWSDETLQYFLLSLYNYKSIEII